MKLNDIKCKNLLNLIRIRYLERGSEKSFDRYLKDNVSICMLFLFDETPEGLDFWWDVCNGVITKIETK